MKPKPARNNAPRQDADQTPPPNAKTDGSRRLEPMMLFKYTGSKRAEFEVQDVKGSDVREFAVSPLGFEMLIRTDERIVHVKMNQKR